MDNCNNKHHTKQLSLNFSAVRDDKVKAVVVDFDAARVKKNGTIKEKAITALLKEAEHLTW